MSSGRAQVVLPSDDHVHSQWSWDAVSGSMERTCARAVDIGVRSVAFTEHADVTAWQVPPGASLPEDWAHRLEQGRLTPPPLDLAGYRECLERCREQFPDLRIVSGVEMSEPHWHVESYDALLAQGGFERRLASVHSSLVGDGAGAVEVSQRYLDLAPDQVVRDYLAETVLLIQGYDSFEVLAHVDYPVRYWPVGAPAYDPTDFEDDYRRVLSALAATGRVLEVNTRVPLHLEVVRWWYDEGGEAISFASDAHEPGALAAGFADAVQLAEAAGFRRARDPLAFWARA
jgi:histidinol-phosphatase (PHP family)